MAKKTQKRIASDWFSRMVRLQAVKSFRAKYGDDSDYVECCTCGRIVHVKKAQLGHYKPRGSGGGSGAYFDERNVGAQCRLCNAFRQGRPAEFREYLVKKWREAEVCKVEVLHKLPSRWGPRQYPGLILDFKQRTKQLQKELKIEAWW